MSTAQLEPLPRRGWRPRLRFSLRTLLIAVTVVGIWLGIKFSAARQQHAAAAGIRALGGWFYYDYQLVGGKFAPNAEPSEPRWLRALVGEDFFHDIVEVNMVYNDLGPGRLDNNQLTDELKTHLPALAGLHILLLKETQATDGCLKVVSQLKNLEKIYMWDASLVTDAGTAQLSRLPRLKYIHLSKSQITDESLRVFGTMPQLEGLSLQENYFTDAGLAQLKDLKNLTSLWVDLGQTQITDAGLLPLYDLKNLKELGVQKTQVTPEGVAKIQTAIPGLKVVYP